MRWKYLVLVSMVRNCKNSLFLFLGFLISSCSANTGTDDIDSRFFAPLRATEEVEDLTPFVSDLEVLQIGADSVGRPGISKILFSDPIVFLSGGVVFSASPDFQVIRKVGDVGRGPGEYLSIKDIAINSDGDELWCMDVLNSVLRYDLKTMAFLGKIDFEKDQREYARAMIPQEGNTIALYTPNPDGFFPQHHETFFCLSFFNASGKDIDRQLPWTQYNVMAGFSNPVSAADQGEYVLAPESSNIAYVFSGNGLDHKLVFDFGPKWIPSDFFNPKHGDPAKKVGDLFDMDCFKLISSVYFPGGNLYFHAYGKESSSWNFLLSKDGSHGIRWKSVGILSPPIYAIASEGEYLFFHYDDYGLVEEEKDPLKKYVIRKNGLPAKTGSSYLIKVKFDVD